MTRSTNLSLLLAIFCSLLWAASVHAQNEFVIKPGAKPRSIVISNSDKPGDTGSRIGMGTANPGTDLHIVSGNSPRFRLQQNGTAGNPNQIWDIVANDTAWTVRDVSSATNPLRILAGGANKTLVIANGGFVGINTDVPGDLLDITGSTPTIEFTDASTGHKWEVEGDDSEFTIEDEDGDEVFNIASGAPQDSLNVESDGRITFSLWELEATANELGFSRPLLSANRPFVIFTNDTEQAPDGCLSIDNESEGEVSINRGFNNAGHPLHVGTDTTNGNGARCTAAGVWTNGSSRKNKQNITDIGAEEALQALDQLNPVTYSGKQDPSNEVYAGFIAEDVPDMVATQERDGVAAIEVVAVVTRVVKEQQKEMKELRRQNQELVERLQALEQKISQAKE